MTLMLVHPPVEAGESLCITFEACIHASKGAQVPHDHVLMIEFYFYFECIFWILYQLVSPSGEGLSTKTPPRISWGQWELVFFFITFYHLAAHAPSLGSWRDLANCV